MEPKLAQPNHEALIAENSHLLSKLNIARREIMRLQAHEHIKIRQAINEPALQFKEYENKTQQINELEQRLITILREHNRLQAPRTWRITKPFIRLIDKLYAVRRRLDEQRLSRQLISQSLFDPEYYLTQYPDVRQVGIAPVVHYLRYGWWEGRNPNPDFDTQAYLAQNPDVKMAAINPLLHYAQHGKSEGRTIGGKA